MQYNMLFQPLSGTRREVSMERWPRGSDAAALGVSLMDGARRTGSEQLPSCASPPLVMAAEPSMG